MKNRTKIPFRRRVSGFFHLVYSFRRKMTADKIDVYSAQSAFYLMMSVVPMLMLMFTILQFTPLSKEMILEALAEIAHPEIMERVNEIVNNVYSGSFTLISFSALSLLWVAGRGITGLTNGLNNIHHLRENRNYILQRIRSSFYTVLLVAAFIVAAGMLVLGVRFRTYITALFPFLPNNVFFFRLLLIPAALIILTLIFNALYVFLPNRKKQFSSQIWGAVFTTLSWCLFSFFFSIYLSVAKNLSVIYGGLLTIVVAMLWLYSCIYLFFFGAEINAWRENPDILPF